MRFKTTIQLTTTWLVLQGTLSSVHGISLRGLLGSGLMEDEDVTVLPTLPGPTNPTPKAKGDCTPTGSAQLWLGHYSIDTEFDQAKIWVISSNTNHHALGTAGTWLPLAESKKPSDYVGFVKGCTKFFSIGAGGSDSDPEKLVASLNRPDDVKGIEQAKRIKTITGSNTFSSFMTSINNALASVNQNFAVINSRTKGVTGTILKYKILPHWKYQPGTGEAGGDWYKKGYGWAEFNANGFISGLLDFLQLGEFLPADDGILLYGWDKPIPESFFQHKFLTVEKMKDEVYKTHVCEGGKAEIWVGYHPVYAGEQDVSVDHAKLWIISSNPNHHTPTTLWNTLIPERVPSGYGADRRCAKFYTLGSGFDPKEIVGVVNNQDDVNFNLTGAVKVVSGVNPNNLEKLFIVPANSNIKATFEKTTLRRTTAFPQEWNDWGFGWNEFNGNGYISGFLNYLTTLSNKIVQGTMPCGGNLVGWEKDIPVSFFTKTYTKNQDVKNIIFHEHPPLYSSLSKVEEVQAFSTEEEALLVPEEEPIEGTDAQTTVEKTPEPSEETQAGEETPEPTFDSSLSSSPTPFLESYPEESSEPDLMNAPPL